MNILSSIAGGLAGAVAVTLLNEVLKKYDPEAPRLDRLGMNALSKGLKKTDHAVPDQDKLYNYSLLGDLLTNTLYFSFAGKGSQRKSLFRGGLLGLSSGMGAVFAPGYLNLNDDATNKTTKTQLMTVGYYLLGGMVAGAVGKLVEKKLRH
ncbi:MAG TPA: hypothetical protein VGE26_06650 [Sphingobacteriaceae bacterium]